MRVWGIASEDNRETLLNFANTFGLSFPILEDPGGSVHAQYEMNQAFPTAAYPQDWIIGPDGTILYVNNGFEPDEMRFVIERSLQD